MLANITPKIISFSPSNLNVNNNYRAKFALKASRKIQEQEYAPVWGCA